MSTIKSILIFILIITNLTSCTKKLWRKSYYVENFKNFMATKDGKKIVIFGKKYHYVFDDESKTIIKLLSWENKSKLEIENYNFIKRFIIFFVIYVRVVICNFYIYRNIYYWFYRYYYL